MPPTWHRIACRPYSRAICKKSPFSPAGRIWNGFCTLLLTVPPRHAIILACCLFSHVLTTIHSQPSFGEEGLMFAELVDGHTAAHRRPQGNVSFDLFSPCEQSLRRIYAGETKQFSFKVMASTFGGSGERVAHGAAAFLQARHGERMPALPRSPLLGWMGANPSPSRRGVCVCVSLVVSVCFVCCCACARLPALCCGRWHDVGRDSSGIPFSLCGCGGGVGAFSMRGGVEGCFWKQESRAHSAENRREGDVMVMFSWVNKLISSERVGHPEKE